MGKNCYQWVAHCKSYNYGHPIVSNKDEATKLIAGQCYTVEDTQLRSYPFDTW